MTGFQPIRRVAIVGAGPAGCVAAILLGRAGFDVTLFEQHSFPRDKVCGECLSATGIDVLSTLDLDQLLIDRCHPVILNRSIFYAKDGATAELTLPRPMWGISRASLDAALLECAQRYSAVHQPTRVEHVVEASDGEGELPDVARASSPCERQSNKAARGLASFSALHHGQDARATSTLPGTVVIASRNLETNVVSRQMFDVVLVADGKGAFGLPKPPATDDLGIKSHWLSVDAPRNAIELFGVDGHYGGIAPIDGEQFNISFSVPAKLLKSHRGDFDSVWRSIVNENAALAKQMRSAVRSGPWLASPLPRFGVAARWPARVIPLGNAAAAIEPIGGEGMGLAMRSAQIAASEIIAAAREHRGVDVEHIRKAYRSLWNRRRVACRLGAAVLSRSAAAAPAIDLLNCAPQLGRVAMNLIGK